MLVTIPPIHYATGQFATSFDGTRIFYGMRGSGPAVVLCDGLGCDGFAWTYLQSHLGLDHTVLHPHYRGHGRSGYPKDAQRIGVVDLARDVLATLDDAHIEQAIWVGHSLGTQVLLEAYRAAPHRVRALILLCGSHGHVTRTFHGSNVLHQVLPYLISMVDHNKLVSRALWARVPARFAFRAARWLREVDAIALREQDFVHYVKHFSSMDPSLWLHMLQAAGEHTAQDILPDIRVPTLVVAAERDTFTPPYVAEAMAKQIPNAEYVLLPRASHAAPVEQPVTLCSFVDNFLQKLHPPSAPTQPRTTRKRRALRASRAGHDV
jgi:pimeloyl-ACP methyl ester carboxylesterase